MGNGYSKVENIDCNLEKLIEALIFFVGVNEVRGKKNGGFTQWLALGTKAKRVRWGSEEFFNLDYLFYIQRILIKVPIF